MGAGASEGGNQSQGRKTARATGGKLRFLKASLCVSWRPLLPMGGEKPEGDGAKGRQQVAAGLPSSTLGPPPRLSLPFVLFPTRAGRTSAGWPELVQAGPQPSHL